MPEGDSVYQLSRRLQFMKDRQVMHTSVRVPRYALANFDGDIVRRVWPYGKHLFMLIGEQVLHTHLKMEGTWSMHLAGDRWTKPAYTARVVLELDGAPQYERNIEVVGHTLGFVRVFHESEYQDQIAHLGPDVYGPNWLSDGHREAKRRMLLRPDRAIGAALLDQKILAGVGNEYRAEICFLAGIHPTTKVGDVDIDHVLDITYRLMEANKLSPIRVSTGVKRAGETSYVFGRNHKPCRRCGTQIKKASLGGVDAGGDEGELERIIWWCPNCQPLGR
ncbi:DNA-formamidopyrimidine glycosylase family protein [Corynebacterium sp. ZY180755]